jgi:anthranilate phosphoribosyltransferase
MIKEAINKIIGGQNLTESEMEIIMLKVLAGESTPSQVGAFLSALRMKGETVDEITGAARALKSKLTPLKKKPSWPPAKQGTKEPVHLMCLQPPSSWWPAAV